MQLHAGGDPREQGEKESRAGSRSGETLLPFFHGGHSDLVGIDKALSLCVDALLLRVLWQTASSSWRRWWARKGRFGQVPSKPLPPLRFKGSHARGRLPR